MRGNAEDWFHLVKEQIHSFLDFCLKFIQKYADKRSIERREKRICQDKPDWSSVKSLEKEIARFITQVTRVEPNITDEALFQEAVIISPYHLQKLLTCTNLEHTEGLLEFLEKQDRLRVKMNNGSRQKKGSNDGTN